MIDIFQSNCVMNYMKSRILGTRLVQKRDKGSHMDNDTRTINWDKGGDVYRIKSIVSYQYHKTDTGIISKWQINDPFNDTFYDDINMDRASLTQKWFFLFY